MTKEPWSAPLRVSELAARKPTRFDLAPDAQARASLAQTLGALSVEALSFRGELRPERRRDWLLEGRLVARVEQPCVVSLAPVPSLIEVEVRRRYVAEMPALEPGSETEMPDETGDEPLGATIDPGEVMAEELALALPLYPRAPGVELGEAVFAPPGAVPLREGEIKPFASLAALRDRLKPSEDG